MKTFRDDCFRHYILNYRGTPVVVEDYSCGDWGDDENWGSFVFDLKNNKYVESFHEFLDAYDQNPVETLDKLKDDWKSIDDNCFYQNNNVKCFYQKMINGGFIGNILDLE